MDLVLQGSNVFGRILFPQRIVIRRNQKSGLGHALSGLTPTRIRTASLTGQMPNSEDFEVLTEAFGETDQNGFFSFI